MSITDQRPSLPPPDRPARTGLVKNWRDAILLLLLLLIAAGAGVAGARYWDSLLFSALNTRIQALEARSGTIDVKSLKERVTKLETNERTMQAALAAGSIGTKLAADAPALVPGATALPADIAARLAALETKSAKADDLKAAKDTLDKLAATVGAVDTRLTKLESSDLLELARRASLATAVANLTRAAQGSAPFKAEFDIVAAMIPGDPRLAEVAPLADTGLPTTGTLLAAFGNSAAAAIDAENAAKGTTWWDKLWSHFASLVSTRPIGEVQGFSTEARIARGEVRLKAGDLAAAVKELSGISGPARDALAGWLDEAKARVHLEAALADVNTRAIEALQAPAPAAPKPPIP